MLKKNCKLNKFFQSIELSGQITASGNLSSLKKSEGKLSIENAVVNTSFSPLSAQRPLDINYHQGKINLFNGNTTRVRIN